MSKEVEAVAIQSQCGKSGGQRRDAAFQVLTRYHEVLEVRSLADLLRQPYWPRGSTGVQRYGCIPRSAANNLGQIPQKLGAPNPLF